MSTPCPNIILAAPVLNTADRFPLLNHHRGEEGKLSLARPALPLLHVPAERHHILLSGQINIQMPPQHFSTRTPQRVSIIPLDVKDGCVGQ